MSADLSHITIDEAEGKADCSVCKTGVTAPPSFGGIPRSDMLASFLVLHSVHTKAGVASGLTAAGRPSNAAREFFDGAS
jgi:hypothetical protein